MKHSKTSSPKTPRTPKVQKMRCPYCVGPKCTCHTDRSVNRRVVKHIEIISFSDLQDFENSLDDAPVGMGVFL